MSEVSEELHEVVYGEAERLLRGRPDEYLRVLVERARMSRGERRALGDRRSKRHALVLGIAAGRELRKRGRVAT